MNGPTPRVIIDSKLHIPTYIINVVKNERALFQSLYLVFTLYITSHFDSTAVERELSKG